jgi:hypothetical protein
MSFVHKRIISAVKRIELVPDRMPCIMLRGRWCLVAKGTIFPHRNINKFSWTLPDGKTHTQIGHILIDRKRHSNIIHVRPFRAADCDV